MPSSQLSERGTLPVLREPSANTHGYPGTPSSRLLTAAPCEPACPRLHGQTWPDTATQNHTRPHTTTHNHIQPHMAKHGHTTTHNHTRPHTHTHTHTHTQPGPSQSLLFGPGTTTLRVGGGEGNGLPDSETPLAPSSLGAPQRNPQQVRGAGLPGSSQYPEEITQEREKAPGKPARPLQGGPAHGDTGQGSGLAAGLPDGSGQMLLVDSAKVTLVSSAEPP